MASVAFIGLGTMGAPMAGHLLAGGHDVTVFNRSPDKCQRLAHRGALVAKSPADASRKADFVFLCVGNCDDLKTAVLGTDGVIHTARRGTVVVDHSTVSPQTARDVAEQLAARGVEFVDAPVSGGDIGAKEARLAIMAGGSASAVASAEPLLRLMGKTIVHTGPVGTGQLTKLVNQILVSVTNLAVCEAMTFAAKNGLSPEKTLQAVGGGAAASWQLANLAPKMHQGDFRPGFTIDLQQKDLSLVMDAAAASTVSLPATSLVNQLFIAAQAAGHGRDGTQRLFSVIERLAEVH